jgi:hypothetical protein
MGVVPAQDPGTGKAKTKIDELNTHKNKPRKDKELKPSRGKSTIYILVPSKEKEWHHRSVLGEVTRMKDRHLKNLTLTRNISPTVRETSHLDATSKSQASNKQDSLSLLSTNLVRQQ